MDQETDRYSTKPVSNQWYQPRHDNKRTHYIIQPPVETVNPLIVTSYLGKRKTIVIVDDNILENLHKQELNSFAKEGEIYLKHFQKPNGTSQTFKPSPNHFRETITMR